MADKSEAERGEDAKVSISPSIPSGNDTVWADVSSLFRLACNDLRSDELISGENFNLFAAMSALEIMDPKMDSGIVSTYYSVDEAIDSGAAPIPLSFDRTVDVQRVIDIMDHLLACEATWHKGGSLAQTVFSCIYLLRPERTSFHALLHSFCRVIRTTCNTVVSAVSDARTNEEEDLFTMAYGLPLKADGDDKCLSMLHAVEETISRQLKACKAPLSKRKVLEDVEPLQTNLDLEEGFCKAVLCRLRFRKHLYHVLTCMRRPQGKGLELAKKHITSCLCELDSMLKSAEFLRDHCACGTLEDGAEDKTTASGCQPIGFDSTLNSRSAAPTPPRAIKLLSWTKAVNYFQKLLHDLDIICSYSLDPVFEGALRFVVDFQKLQPDLVARAYIQLLLVQEGKLYGREPMFAVICRAALLPEGAKNHDVQKNETVGQLGQLLISLLRILCTNTAWQRRKLGKILQDWRIIYVQLELAFRKEFGDITNTSTDQNLCLKICKHILIWVEEQTYWIALRFLVLGFELELYSTSEYCMVYWYIYVILIKLAEKTHLKMMLSNDSSRRKSKKKRDFVKDVGKDYQIPPSVLLLQCYIYIAEGLMMMLASLRNENKIFLCLGPFNTEQERFIQHFELLQKACLPDHASYFSFRETTAHARFSTLSEYNCFKDAQRMAKELRGNFANDPDRMAELRRIEQVAEHNCVALNLLCRLGTLEPSLKISFEFIHHPHFAVAAVKRS
ncbi:N-alpha-acetyltransferase 35, NatC auxiliary subunit isoform X2 [Sesamum indicum]|uniref:N-alpha-acetyltransferase 35, NatC auxiliary subunit isoform X2 n=1 Tax=Sesamum indicum TaxID=4182 RepID=A0A6I9T3X0_SESIN|nr:N-alpha-acetyltransferase 35, NatC auxiliary subunit isoform X2 [Sesamum indicum]